MTGLDPARVRRGLTTRWAGRPLETFDTIGSTNAVALERLGAGLASGALHGLVLAAGEQTAGRGRRGRSWQSPPGRSLAASLIVVPERAVVPPRLVGAVALGIAEGLGAATGLPVEIKWPNDLWIGERKLAGILLEARGAGVVIGFGVNVSQAPGDFPPELRATATSLALAGRALPREDVLAAALNGLEPRLDAVFASATGPAELAAAYRARSLLLGRRVALFDGDTPRAGVVTDLSLTGGLLLATDDGRPLHVPAEHARDVRLA